MNELCEMQNRCNLLSDNPVSGEKKKKKDSVDDRPRESLRN